MLILLTTASYTTLLLGAALLLGLRKPTNVGARTFLACSVLGWLNCPLVLSTVALFKGESSGAALLGGLCLGIFVAAPLGMLYGGVSLFATRRLRRLRDHPTLTAHLSALATVGFTVLGASLLGAVVVMTDGATLTAWVPPLLASVGLAFALVSHFGRWRIRRALFDGGIAGLSRVPLSSLGWTPTDLLPLDEQVTPEADHALITLSRSAGDGAYRAGTQRVPLALVD